MRQSYSHGVLAHGVLGHFLSGRAGLRESLLDIGAQNRRGADDGDDAIHGGRAAAVVCRRLLREKGSREHGRGRRRQHQ